MEYAVYTAGDLVAKAAQCGESEIREQGYQLADTNVKAELQGTIQAAVSALFECPTDLISQSLQAMVKLAEYGESYQRIARRQLIVGKSRAS